MATADALFLLLLLLSSTCNGSSSAPPLVPADDGSNSALPLEEASLALPLVSAGDGSSYAPPFVFADEGAILATPLVSVSEGPTPTSSPANFVDDRASCTPHLEPISDDLYATPSVNMRPPGLAGGRPCFPGNPELSTADHFPHPSNCGGLPSSSTLCPSGDEGHPFVMTISTRIATTLPSPAHLPHPTSNSVVLSYFTTPPSPILPTGTEQSTLLFVAKDPLCSAPNSAVDWAIINEESYAPPLVSTGDEPSFFVLFVPKSADNRPALSRLWCPSATRPAPLHLCFPPARRQSLLHPPVQQLNLSTMLLHH